MEIDKQDLELIMMCAMRYAFGRTSYVVGTVQNFIVEHCELENIDKFVKDIERFLKDYEDNFFHKDEWIIQSWKEMIIKLNDKKNHE